MHRRKANRRAPFYGFVTKIGTKDAMLLLFCLYTFGSWGWASISLKQNPQVHIQLLRPWLSHWLCQLNRGWKNVGWRERDNVPMGAGVSPISVHRVVFWSEARENSGFDGYTFCGMPQYRSSEFRPFLHLPYPWIFFFFCIVRPHSLLARANWIALPFDQQSTMPRRLLLSRALCTIVDHFLFSPFFQPRLAEFSGLADSIRTCTATFPCFLHFLYSVSWSSRLQTGQHGCTYLKKIAILSSLHARHLEKKNLFRRL